MAAYFDSTYLVKLRCDETGSEQVRAHAGSFPHIRCSLHGRAEIVAAAHRKVREGAATPSQLASFIAQVVSDTTNGAIVWLPVTESLIYRIEKFFASATATTYLRAADALHLATAAEHGFTEIHSNDRHLLAAAPLFGLRGVNVIS